MRLLDGQGDAKLIWPNKRQVQWTAAMIDVSRGAAFHVPVVTVTNIPRCLRDLKEKGWWVYGLDLQSHSVAPWGVDFSAPICLVMGQEGKGMSSHVGGQCDGIITLPMNGFVESYNVATSLAMCLSERFRQKK